MGKRIPKKKCAFWHRQKYFQTWTVERDWVGLGLVKSTKLTDNNKNMLWFDETNKEKSGANYVVGFLSKYH